MCMKNFKYRNKENMKGKVQDAKLLKLADMGD
jgi:hypothetical protein